MPRIKFNVFSATQRYFNFISSSVQFYCESKACYYINYFCIGNKVVVILCRLPLSVAVNLRFHFQGVAHCAPTHTNNT